MTDLFLWYTNTKLASDNLLTKVRLNNNKTENIFISVSLQLAVSGSLAEQQDLVQSTKNPHQSDSGTDPRSTAVVTANLGDAVLQGVVLHWYGVENLYCLW